MQIRLEFDHNWFRPESCIAIVYDVDLVILGRAQVLCQVALPAHVEK